jgi:hypothetical protein
MCAVSMITDHYRDKWPLPDFGQIQMVPYPVPAPPLMDLDAIQKALGGKRITQAEWDEYQELKRKAEEYDKRTNQPDCAKPGVAEWEAAIESVLVKRGLLPAAE